MTSLRWDTVPKPRVERPPLLAPSSRSARRKQTPPDLKNRTGGAGRARTGLHDRAGSARAARATGATRESSRCAACKARGITLWRFSGRLVCGNCRGEMWADYYRSPRQAPASTQRTSPGPGKRTGPPRSSALSDERLARLRDLQRQLNPPEAIRDAWR
jgi:hypothetical protein